MNSVIPPFIFWLLLAAIFQFTSELFEFMERRSRGPGTWKPDRQLLRLSGAAILCGIGCTAMAINALIEAICG